jgi:glycosyltransferase involved in cell wall biosynthesis
VAKAALEIQRRGFRPDIICCHPGWGEGLFLRDVFPDAKLLYYWEFYYTAEGADVGFDPPGPVSLDEAARVRMMNATHLLSLQAADWGHAPTAWQRSRFPDWARERISVIHEGVDTHALRPDPNAAFRLPDGRTLRPGDEVISFVARGLEPYRGFHVFLRALPEIMAARPELQVVVVGGDDPHYGSKPPDGTNWRRVLLAELEGRLDTARLHFTGKVPHAMLNALFSITRAHIYLTYPFVLSWSMLEAMAAEALVIGSATAPVEEVIRHGQNGLLVDFFDPGALAQTTIEVLRRPGEHRALRRAARETVVTRFDLRGVCLPRLLDLVVDLAEGRQPRGGGPA